MHANVLPTTLPPIDIGGVPRPATASDWAPASRSTSRPARSPNSDGRAPPRPFCRVDPVEQVVGLFMTQSMMSFDLPELELCALAYQAVVDWGALRQN